jgi:hypothetical protein
MVKKSRDMKQIGVYVNTQQYKRFKEVAGKENRALGNMMLVMAERYLEQVDPDTFKALEAASHALKSYAYGNAAPELAKEAGIVLERALNRLRGNHGSQS